jgi:predicted MFS family arabinose efflux permease
VGASPNGIALIGFASLAVAMGIGRFAATPVFPMMQSGAGLSIAGGAWLASANYAGYLVGALSAIGLRLGPGSAIRAGLCTIALTTVAVGLTQEFFVWVVLRALAGIASAWVLVFVSAWCLEALPRLGRPGLAGLVFAGVGFGIATAGSLCLYLQQVGAPWEAAWIALGLLAAGGTALGWRALPGASAGRDAAAGASAWNAGWSLLVLAYATFGFGYIIPATFLPALAKQQYADLGVFAWFWPLFGLAAAASTLAVTTFGQAARARRLWLGAQAVMAVSVALLVVLPGLGGVGLATLGIGGTFMVITMTGLRVAREVAGPAAPRLIATMTAAFASGQIAGPVLVGFTDGFSAALLSASAALALGGVALARGDSPKTTHERR